MFLGRFFYCGMSARYVLVLSQVYIDGYSHDFCLYFMCQIKLDLTLGLCTEENYTHQSATQFTEMNFIRLLLIPDIPQ